MNISNLIRYNDWWVTGHPRKELLMPYKRPLFKKMMEYINDRQILILYGLRRVGKTTLLYQFIDELLSRGVKAEHILYFSFDEIETKIDDLILAHEENILRSPIVTQEKYTLYWMRFRRQRTGKIE